MAFSRAAVLLCVLALASGSVADLALTPRQVPATTVTGTTVPATTTVPAQTAPLPTTPVTTTPATGVNARGPGRLPAGIPANNKVPGATAPKTLPRAQAPPEVTVVCQTVPQNPPFKITTCSVTSRATTAVCVHLNCDPLPSQPCVGGVPPVIGQGKWTPALAKPNQNCSWVLTPECASPTPLFPLPNPKKPEGQWGFGFMSPYQGNIAISVAKVTPAQDGTCQKAAPVAPAVTTVTPVTPGTPVTPVTPAAKAPVVRAPVATPKQ